MILLKFLLWVTLLQLANGQILVTLVNENGSPVAQENISFITSEQQVLASCVTSPQGRCTITIEDAPTDASGFIRGSLLLDDRGQRPVLWPGGQIEVQLVLKNERLSVPSDAYVTRTPKLEPTATVSVQVEPTATVEIQVEPTTTVEIQVEPTATVEVQVEPTATTQVKNPQLITFSDSFLFQAFLFLVIAIAIAFYIIKSIQKS